MTARVRSIAPQLLVDDLDTALVYYRDRLGFTVDFTYESFYAQPLGVRPWGHTDFYVEDADGYILSFSEDKA